MPNPIITLEGKPFTIASRYSEGQTITAGEANALNSLMRDNIRNNFRKPYLQAVANGTPTEIIQQSLDDYVNAYHFAEPRANKPDPVELEAHRFAKQAVIKALRTGKIDPYKDLAEGELEAKVQALLTSNPSIRELAKGRVAELQAIAQAALLGDD